MDCVKNGVLTFVQYMYAFTLLIDFNFIVFVLFFFWLITFAFFTLYFSPSKIASLSLFHSSKKYSDIFIMDCLFVFIFKCDNLFHPCWKTNKMYENETIQGVTLVFLFIHIKFSSSRKKMTEQTMNRDQNLFCFLFWKKTVWRFT